MQRTPYFTRFFLGMESSYYLVTMRQEYVHPTFTVRLPTTVTFLSIWKTFLYDHSSIMYGSTRYLLYE